MEKTKKSDLNSSSHTSLKNIISALETLIALLQAALGKMPEIKNKEINWEEIYELSRRQEVTAIALDGLQKLVNFQPNLFACSSSSEKKLKMRWIGSMMTQERLYTTNLFSAKKLATLYDKNEMYTYVLKGFSISQLYPIPTHRFSCDLDCFLLPQSGTFDAYELGNSLARKDGSNVDAGYYKHSVFSYGSLIVENHRYCCSVKRSKRTKKLEIYLESLLKDYTPLYLANTKMALPPPMFQALFFIEHANGHFLYSKMSLKHVCDWAMMRKAFKDMLDWAEFDKQCIRFGLKNFVICLNHLTNYIVGECNYQDLGPLDRRVLKDIFKEVHFSKNSALQRLQKACSVICSSWKFKHFCSDSMIKELSHSVWAYLYQDNPELD